MKGKAKKRARRLVEPYPVIYSILTVHFAAGSEPEALAIPYLPGQNRTDLHVPYRLVPAEEQP